MSSQILRKEHHLIITLILKGPSYSRHSSVAAQTKQHVFCSSFARLAFLLVAELFYPFAADTYAAIRTRVPGFEQGQRVSDSPVNLPGFGARVGLLWHPAYWVLSLLGVTRLLLLFQLKLI